MTLNMLAKRKATAAIRSYMNLTHLAAQRSVRQPAYVYVVRLSVYRTLALGHVSADLPRPDVARIALDRAHLHFLRRGCPVDRSRCRFSCTHGRRR